MVHSSLGHWHGNRVWQAPRRRAKPAGGKPHLTQVHLAEPRIPTPMLDFGDPQQRHDDVQRLVSGATGALSIFTSSAIGTTAPLEVLTYSLRNVSGSVSSRRYVIGSRLLAGSGSLFFHATEM
jgi:hypothetical protein